MYYTPPILEVREVVFRIGEWHDPVLLRTIREIVSDDKVVDEVRDQLQEGIGASPESPLLPVIRPGGWLRVSSAQLSAESIDIDFVSATRTAESRSPVVTCSPGRQIASMAWGDSYWCRHVGTGQ